MINLSMKMLTKLLPISYEAITTCSKKLTSYNSLSTKLLSNDRLISTTTYQQIAFSKF